MRPQNDVKTIVYDVILILCGIFGCVGCFVTTFAIEVSPTFIGMLFLSMIVVFFIMNSLHKHFRVLSLLSIVLWLIFIILNFDACKVGFFYILDCILNTYEANSQYRFQSFSSNTYAGNRMVNQAMGAIFMPIIMVVVYSIRQRNSYFLAFMVTIPFLFAILLFTLVPPWNFFCMLLIFYIAMLGMQVASRYDTHSAPDSIRKLGFVFAICSIIVIVAIQSFVPISNYVRDAKVDAFRLQIQTSIRDMIYGTSSQQSGLVDLASAKNRFYIGNVELLVKSDKKNTIYLHGYSGTLYKDNTWYTPEASYYQNKFDFSTSPHPFDISYEFFEQLSTAQQTASETQTLEITYEDAYKTYVYTPYYNLEASLDNDAYVLSADAYVTPSNEERSSYTFTTLSQDALPREGEMTPFAQSYIDAVTFTNLNVPSEVEYGFRDMQISGITKTSPKEDKIKAIQTYMQNFGTYTLSPGETPAQTDFILNFLKNKQGYCVHYASTATMLLRLYGVPARYAEGYRVDPADFEDDIATVKDYNAHAWVEVFDDRFGWVPLEVTPASAYGSGTTNTTLQNQDPSIQSQNQVSNPTQDTPAQTTQPKDSEQGNTLSTQLPFVFLFGLLILMSALPLRRIMILKKKEQLQHQENRKEAILEVAKDLAYFVQDKNIPKDIKDILEEARFSTHQLHEEQYVLIMQYKKHVRKVKFAACTRKEKMMYIWWYCI